MVRNHRFIVFAVLSASLCWGEVEVRKTALKAAENAGLGGWLRAPVQVGLTEGGVVAIQDAGVYFFQYDLETPQASAEPNVVMSSFTLPVTVDKAVFITHGWADKAQNDWPERMAGAIRQKTDPNEWVCGFYGWSGGSGVITSIQAAKYARDIGGPRLGAVILKLPVSLRHIHFVGHSAGSWVIDSAAKRIVKERPDISLHMTFLDAYIPDGWESGELGDEKPAGGIWAEQYYTRDITYTMTQYNLGHAHNVDITAIDPLVAEHEFPYRWYLATITGMYDRWDEKGQDVFKTIGEIEYGFARSLEAGQANWKKNRSLPSGNKALKLKKTK